jgi:hypothetical protein
MIQSIECETLRGFHASAAGVTPAPSINRAITYDRNLFDV